MSAINETQTLARAADADNVIITTPAQYTAKLKVWEEHYHVLTPFTNITGLAPQHGLIASAVTINVDKSQGEVYDGLPFLGGNEVALAKNGLRKLAECAGISTRTERTDPRTIANYWEFKAIASYRTVDGSTTTREATKEWDLRDGSPQLKGWTPKQIEEGRKNGLRNCEARAINAAIRECGCGIRQKYTRAELQKPFLVLRVAFQPDMSDPQTRRLVTEHALGSTATLYPQAAQLPSHTSAPEPEQEEAQPRPVGRSSTVPALSPAAADEPPTPDAVRITKVDEKSGETKGRKWTRFLIVDSRGEEHSTFDRALAEAAQRFRDEKTWVEITEERDGDYKNLLEIVRAGQQPKLPQMGML